MILNHYNHLIRLTKTINFFLHCKGLTKIKMLIHPIDGYHVSELTMQISSFNLSYSSNFLFHNMLTLNNSSVSLSLATHLNFFLFSTPKKSNYLVVTYSVYCFETRSKKRFWYSPILVEFHFHSSSFEHHILAIFFNCFLYIF